VAKAELGTKRVCPNCGTKYYDLNKNPIICPKCGTYFEAPTRPRAAPVAPVVAGEKAVGRRARGRYRVPFNPGKPTRLPAAPRKRRRWRSPPGGIRLEVEDERRRRHRIIGGVMRTRSQTKMTDDR
jgi:hypothetical protein